MRQYFSFKYGDKRCELSALDNAVYTLADGVSARVAVKKYPECDAVEWLICFENRSDKNSEIISEIWDSDTLLPLDMPEPKRQGYRPTVGDACVITMNGMVEGRLYWENDKASAEEYGLNYEYLDKAPNKTKKFQNIGSRSSEGMMPFFDATANGAGYICAIGWSGGWKTEFSRETSGIRMKSGLQKAAFYLKPGESLRTTATLVMKYSVGEDKYNKFRALIRNHYSHISTSKDAREGLLACEMWGGLPSTEMKKRLRELDAHGVNFEDVWIDAGWYGECTKCDDAFSGDWWSHTGDWSVNRRVHPEELVDVAECAAECGARLMLWFEPERAVCTTKLFSEHPEWFLKVEGASTALLDYGNDEARGYILDTISYYVEKLELSCYRQDFNCQPTVFFDANDGEGRVGISEIKHISGMYKMWDELLTKYPTLIIDNCASGGRRFDIETLKRSIPFFRSDYQCNFNENPEVIQAHNSGAALYMPYLGCTTKTKGDTYAARSAYSSSFGGAFYNAVFQSMDEGDFVWAKAVIDEYKSIRHYLSRDFYNHASVSFDDTSWAIWQYHDPDTDSGIVMAFRRENSPFDNVKINLKGVRAGKSYAAKSISDGAVSSISDTLEITLPEKRSSIIIEYK